MLGIPLRALTCGSRKVPQLPTNAKLQIARILYSGVAFGRSVLGKSGTQVTCKRRGLNWDLDLKEGIELAIYLLGRFEKDTEKAICKHVRPGMVVFDIGANIGAHALPMAKYVGPTGRVYAIEPTDRAFKKLLRNKDLNSELESALIPIQAALNEQGGTLPKELYSSWDLTEVDKHPLHGGSLCSISGAENTTLDDLVERLGLSRLDFVKMDVDGFECKVLRGGKKTFSKYTPKIILELCPYVLDEHGDSFGGLLELLRGFGYQLYSEDGQKRLPTNPTELAELIPRNGGINALGWVAT